MVYHKISTLIVQSFKCRLSISPSLAKSFSCVRLFLTLPWVEAKPERNDSAQIFRKVTLRIKAAYKKPAFQFQRSIQPPEEICL